MTDLPLGMMILVVVSTLIYLFLLYRVLDRLRLSDKVAILLLVGIIVGSFIDIPLFKGDIEISINIGGALIPLGLVIYLWIYAGTNKERVRSLVGAVVTALAIWLVGSLWGMGASSDPGDVGGFIDILWLYPLVAGIVGYLVGRSRRSSFISAAFGLIIFDIGYGIWLFMQNAPHGRLDMGGAGLFDVILTSAVFAVLLAEIVGEIRERIAGGPKSEGRPPELIKNLHKPVLEDGAFEDGKKGGNK